MTATAAQTYTVIGLALDVDSTELLIAAVVGGAVADQVELLATSEEDFTRWVEEFNAPDPDTAAELAYAYCRTFGGAADAGEYLHEVLEREDVHGTVGGHPGSGCYWVSIATPDGGEIRISGRGRAGGDVHYPLNDHTGWVVRRQVDNEPEPTVLYDSQDPDLAADTAAAVAAVRAILTTG